MLNSERYSFHNYAETTSELEDIANNYSDITNLYDLGYSVLGRTIWGLKITDNPDIEENEPEVRICGAHHGDEYMSVELPLLLALHLVENYSIDPGITNLIDDREIWIIPLVNPDGREASSRYNNNGVDLNRDYGYMWDGSGGSPSPFSQPETQVIRDNALKNNYVLSLSYHTTAAYVNYIWNYKPQPAPDEAVVVMLSNQYAASSGYTAINGFDWYQTKGDTNDFSYGCRGDIDWTIETGNSDIGYTWNKNRDAMIDIIDAADMGLSGVVTDANTGEPIAATIWVEELYWPCFNDPLVGDYYKPLLPGSYTVHFRANGYEEQIHTIDIIDANATNILDASLVPEDNYYAYQVTSCHYFNYNYNPTEGISSLGPPDNISASIGVGGEIVLDMGNHSKIINGEGNDFVVYEADEVSDGYNVYVSNFWNGPWENIGSGFGTSYFDLEDVGLDEACFVKIIDDGDGSPTETNPGFDLDAIQSLNSYIAPICYVDDDADQSWYDAVHVRTIQEGIDNSSENNTVYVYNGIYNEHDIVIDKSIKLIGENKENTIVKGDWNNNIFLVNANHTLVKNFYITQGGNMMKSCIDVSANNCIIQDNIINGSNDMGILLQSSENNTIVNNIIANCTFSGISLFENNYNNIIIHNDIGDNDIGVKVKLSSNNNIVSNDLLNNDYGIYINDSSINNLIYHNNLLDNNQNAYDDSTNIWSNIQLQEGNHWSDYLGLFSREDGIGETPYAIMGGSNEDIYPLLNESPNIPVMFKTGWNMVSPSINNTWWASTLAENISGCQMLSWFDATSQELKTHVVAAPVYDFPITYGMGYFVLVNTDSIFSFSGIPLFDVSVDISIGWNMIGWYPDRTTTASSIAENITGCQMLSWFDATSQELKTHVVAAPVYDYNVDCGMGLFILTNTTSTWNCNG
jgi:parallel beta-helix repeat protein